MAIETTVLANASFELDKKTISFSFFRRQQQRALEIRKEQSRLHLNTPETVSAAFTSSSSLLSGTPKKREKKNKRNTV